MKSGNNAETLMSIVSSVNLKNKDEIEFIMDLLRGCGLYVSNPSVVSKFISDKNTVVYRFVVDGCIITAELVLQQKIIKYSVITGGFVVSTNYCNIDAEK